MFTDFQAPTFVRGPQTYDRQLPPSQQPGSQVQPCLARLDAESARCTRCVWVVGGGKEILQFCPKFFFFFLLSFNTTPDLLLPFCFFCEFLSGSIATVSSKLVHPDCLLRGQYDNATLVRLDLERGVVWTQFEVMTLRQVVNILLPFFLPGLVTSIVVFRGLVCQGESFFRFFVFRPISHRPIN